MTIDQFTIEQEEIDAIYYRIADERIHFCLPSAYALLEPCQRCVYWRNLTVMEFTYHYERQEPQQLKYF